MTDLKLAYYGNPILRKKAKPVKTFDDALKAYVKSLIEFVENDDTVGGVAAPQLHRSLRVFVAQPPDYDEETGDWIEGPAKAYINPVIKTKSPEVWDYEEGCISIPKLYAKVPRYWAITVEYQDVDGNFHTEELKGYPARVFQHEYDHLNGVLFIDRIMGKPRQALEPKLREIKEKYSS